MSADSISAIFRSVVFSVELLFYVVGCNLKVVFQYICVPLDDEVKKHINTRERVELHSCRGRFIQSRSLFEKHDLNVEGNSRARFIPTL